MRQVCVALAVLVVLAGCSGEAEPAAQPSSTPSSAKGVHMTVTVPAAERWRTEVWGDVQLEVPRGWALGYAPIPNATGALQCGVGPLEGGGEEGGPYVGRPGHGSDVCLRTGLDELGLAGEGVWFGSALPEGEVVAKTGLHQTTVAVAGSHVTVAAYDDPVRERVLASVTRVGRDAHGCPAQPDVERGYPDEGYGEVRSLAVCVYEHSKGWSRMWTTSLPARRGEMLVEAAEDAERGERCRAPDTSQLVLVRVTADDPMGDEPLLRDFVARPSRCTSLQHWGVGGEWLRLTPELVRPWAHVGVRSYVYSNGMPRALDRFFRSMWG